MTHPMKAIVASALLCVGLGLNSGALWAAQAPQAAEPTEELQPMTQPLPLSVYRVKSNLGKPGLYLFDCNPEEIYKRSHVPGAIMTNVAHWKSLLPKDKKNAYLVFYCVNKLCNVSTEAAFEALRMGYYNVFIMPDGIQGWVGHGYEFEGTGRQDAALNESLKEAAEKGISIAEMKKSFTDKPAPETKTK